MSRIDQARARAGPDASPAGPAAPGCWRSVRVLGRVVARPPRVRLDLNGVVKALAVDDALALFDGPGFVSAGGDVAVRGGAVVGLPRGGSSHRPASTRTWPRRPRSCSRTTGLGGSTSAGSRAGSSPETSSS